MRRQPFGARKDGILVLGKGRISGGKLHGGQVKVLAVQGECVRSEGVERVLKIDFLFFFVL